MISYLRTILGKTRQRGWRWFWRRLCREFSTPETAVGHRVRGVNRGGQSAWLRPVATTARWATGVGGVGEQTLYLFYDLEVSPITYDFLWALVAAEQQRCALGLDRVHVVIVPGRTGGLRVEETVYEAVVDADDRRMRIQTMLVPMVDLLPSCHAVSVLADRGEAAYWCRVIARHRYPAEYDPAFPVAPQYRDCVEPAHRGIPYAVLNAPSHAVRNVADWLARESRGRRVVTITLRNYGYNPQRNSDFTAWAQFAAELDQLGYCVVIVPDAAQVFEAPAAGFERFVHFALGSIQLHFRAALYELAWLNLGVNGGPMHVAFLNRGCRYIAFKIRVPGVDLCSDGHVLGQGFIPDQSLPQAAPWQRLVWGEDSLRNLRWHFTEVSELLN